MTRNSHEISDIQVVDQIVRVTKLVLAQICLYATRPVGKMKERRLPMPANGNNPTRDLALDIRPVILESLK
jgi:hypothetical protein